jgi:hypothetical protein
MIAVYGNVVISTSLFTGSAGMSFNKIYNNDVSAFTYRATPGLGFLGIGSITTT